MKMMMMIPPPRVKVLIPRGWRGDATTSSAAINANKGGESVHIEWKGQTGGRGLTNSAESSLFAKNHPVNITTKVAVSHFCRFSIRRGRPAQRWETEMAKENGGLKYLTIYG